MEPCKIIVEVSGGMVQQIYGDRIPENIELEFIVRDFDNIEAGDPDPVGENYEPAVYYW